MDRVRAAVRLVREPRPIERCAARNLRVLLVTYWPPDPPSEHDRTDLWWWVGFAILAFLTYMVLS
jgi:hypothetical protein